MSNALRAAGKRSHRQRAFPTGGPRGPAGVPVYYFCPDAESFFFDRSKARRKGPFFAASHFNTSDYRRLVEWLNDRTGLLVSSFQGGDSGSEIAIDGTRGSQFAQKERIPRPPKPSVKPDELLAASSGADLHVIGIYSTGPGLNGSPVDVEVRPTARPVVLALSSYFSVLWRVKLAKGAQVKAVIIDGYFEQEIEGIPPGIPVAYRAYFPDRPRAFYWGYDRDSVECKELLKALTTTTGRPVSTFQGEYSGSSFVVYDAKRFQEPNAERFQEPIRPAAARQQAKPVEEPAADVADIPSEEREAKGDAHKRYFLIGPRKNTPAPTAGFGLVIIMPGGDGSADFHPFVKRIYKNALPDRYLAAQPVAVKWTPDQKIVWPTSLSKVAGMKFTTEDFVESLIDDVAKKHKLDRSKIFTLSWSSSGPAAYAISLQPKSPVRGSFIAMSVFKPNLLPDLKLARGHAYYLFHSEQDRICPFRMAEQAKTSLAEIGATVRLETYEGGHGWRGNVFHDIRAGIDWLDRNKKISSGQTTEH